MDWRSILEQMQTENIMSYIQDIDPLTFLKQPEVMIILIVVLGSMLFLRMIKSVAFIIGLIVIWIAMAYFLPETSENELQLIRMGPFAGICLGVAAVWIYLFFVRVE